MENIMFYFYNHELLFLVFLCCPPLFFWFGAFYFCQFSFLCQIVTHRLTPGSSPSPRLVIQPISPSIQPCSPSSVFSSTLLTPFSHFPLLLLSNCQAALGPAQHLRHRLLILLDHRKKHVCLWNVQASLDYDYMAAECVWVCAHMLVCISAGSYFFSCNESRWGESVSAPPPPPPPHISRNFSSPPPLPLALTVGWGCAFYWLCGLWW